MGETIVHGIKVAIRWLQQNPVLAFVAGALLSIGGQLLFTDALQRNVSVLIIAVSILVLFTITSMNRITEAIVSLFKAPPFIGFTSYGEDQVAEAFTKSIEVIRRSNNDCC